MTEPSRPDGDASASTRAGEGVVAPPAGRARRALSRRDLLGLAGKGAAGVVVVGAAATSGYGARGSASASSPASTAGSAKKRAGALKTRPGLDPPRVQIVDLDAASSSGYILVTPSLVPNARGVDEAKAIAEGNGQEGVMILDHRGRLVWFEPTPGLATNLQVQSYRGEPVLTYWMGSIVKGIGSGEGVVLDASYRRVATVRAGNGARTDLHDFVLTPEGTALVTAYRKRSADLSSVGGPADGEVEDSLVQEIDVASGKLLHEWRSLDHVGVDESYASPAHGAFDYFHVNSASLDADGQLLVSARNTWTLYKLDRSTGAVIWRLGGKKSDFTMGPGTNFEWQHHTRRLPDGRISIFDDGATPPVESQSRAILLNLDEASHVATLDRAYTHPAKLLAGYEGSVQVLPDGHVFVGWGDEPYFTEFDQAGSVLLDGRFPTNDQSYRAFRSTWVGRPSKAPDIVVEKDVVGGLAVYASWNGATEPTHWQIIAGDHPSALEPVATLAKAGFETAMTARTMYKHVAVAALDATGRRLGVSKPVAI